MTCLSARRRRCALQWPVALSARPVRAQGLATYLFRGDSQARQRSTRQRRRGRLQRLEMFCSHDRGRLQAHGDLHGLSGPHAAKTSAFKWVNTALSNIKAAVVGTYRAMREKHAPCYLTEFEYRINRICDISEMIPRLAFLAIRTLPMPYLLLKVADFQA